MGVGRKIDQDLLPRLWAEGLTTGQIAERFGCHPPAVTRMVRTLGLAPRDQGWKPRKAEAPAPPLQPAATLAEAVLTEGRTWAGRLALAERFGVTPAQVLAEFHRRRAQSSRALPPHPRFSPPRAAGEADHPAGGTQIGQGVRG